MGDRRSGKPVYEFQVGVHQFVILQEPDGALYATVGTGSAGSTTSLYFPASYTVIDIERNLRRQYEE